MAQITLRNLDPEVEKEIHRRARASGKSLNRVIREMLGEALSPGEKRKPPGLGPSLAKLAGGWTEKEAAEFLEAIKSCEQVDEGDLEVKIALDTTAYVAFKQNVSALVEYISQLPRARL